jgi:sugar phosphate isomerase/epimerase
MMSPINAIAIQLYTLRGLGDVDRELDAAQAAGFRHVETVGSHLDNSADVAAKLKRRSLTASSSHVSLAALRERPDAVAAACRTLGIAQLFMPSVPPAERDMAASRWTALGHELGGMADQFRSSGIALGYHNHNWELAPKEGGKTALELLFAAAEGSPLTWQVDVAWLVRGGADPKAWIERYKDRVASAHVKDLAPAGEALDEDGWADVGHGVLDWRDLWRCCRGVGARWMVVEHDKPADPVRCARRSFAFLSTIED